MTSLALLFLVVFALNVVPAFAPPTWMAMSLFGLKYPYASPWAVALVAATAATGGRMVLAHLARSIVHGRWLGTAMGDNLTVVAEAIKRRRTASAVAFLFYAFSPLPSNALFLAFGLTAAPLYLLAIPFFIGRLISYGVAFFGGSALSQHLGPDVNWTITWVYIVLTQLLMLAFVYAFTRVDWLKTWHARRLRWLEHAPPS